MTGSNLSGFPIHVIEGQLAPETAAQDEEWEVVNADESASSGTGACCSGAAVRWLGGASVSVAAARESEVQLPALLVTDEYSIKSMMCIAAALARCRHASCPRQEATKLALRYGFVCAEADAISDTDLLRTPPSPCRVSASPHLPSQRAPVTI